MVFVVLIGLFILFYTIIFVSLLKTEGFAILPLCIDLLILISIIVFYYIGGYLKPKDLSNYLMFTMYGSYVYMYFAIKYFWIKPKVVEYVILKEHLNSDEDLEERELNLQTARVRSVYYFIISVMLFIITKLRMNIDLKDDAVSVNSTLMLIGIIIIVLWLIIDFYRKGRYGIFLFKTIVPLTVTIWIIITTLIL
ncbi:DUF5080 family protein [Staphylococcus caprae]|uniref:DUF5080 family protein n=3 Tax=Staphylococcus caprae TaxID=29380 RepID=A0ABM7FR24_9STAP|nr:MULTISPECIES: DUF5080 family protein [Staphylococcus]EES40835.1 hypothetical protein HMPREF0793_1522 [Staphylococcus caprae M23864:W1]MBN6825034.1 DUF5080 family protein [Staphylococcus caprae]MBX5322308.1 DUF5080 family protein [Staphylococcus caprae]MDI0015148.1 DUF5080 family protein [Staphylococcus caprae]MEB8093877.1 DUF5080 family protein [Staphylococcus caprae]